MSDIEGEFLLHQAEKAGEVNVVNDLLANGADKNEKNNKGETPLMVVVDENHLEVVSILVE